MPTSVESTRSNLLIMTTDIQFRQAHISAAISEALNHRRKVLYITNKSNLSSVWHAYQPLVRPGHAGILDDLDVELLSEDKSFLAFENCYSHNQFYTQKGTYSDYD